MVVAAPEHHAVLGPDDLRPEVEAAGGEALGDGRGVERAMPDIGHLAAEQRPGRAPVRPVVVQHVAGAPGGGPGRLIAPGRIVADAVGRVGDHQVRPRPGQRQLHGRAVGAVAADRPMRSEQPGVAGPRHRVGLGLRRLVGVGQPLVAAEQRHELTGVEAEQPEVGPHFAQVGELDPEQRVVPAGVQRQLVVGQHVGALLGFGPAAGDDYRRLRPAEQACRQHAPMAGDDAALLVDEDRDRPSELTHGAGDLRHLRVRVRAGVAGGGHQALQRPALHLVCGPVAAYAGLAPTPWQSGSVQHEQGVSKSGNPRLRTTMIQLAWLWLRHQPKSELSLWFLDRVKRDGGRGKKTTIVALARKLLVALWKFVSSGVVIEGAVMKAA